MLITIIEYNYSSFAKNAEIEIYYIVISRNLQFNESYEKSQKNRCYLVIKILLLTTHYNRRHILFISLRSWVWSG